MSCYDTCFLRECHRMILKTLFYSLANMKTITKTFRVQFPCVKSWVLNASNSCLPFTRPEGFLYSKKFFKMNFSHIALDFLKRQSDLSPC